MSDATPWTLPFDAPLAVWERCASALSAAVRAGEGEAEQAFRWHHPRLDGASMAQVSAEAMAGGFDALDARLVLARMHAFDGWDAARAFTAAVAEDGPVRIFERAAEAVVDGDRASLQELLGRDPALVRARSTRGHRATLLHYLGANGVEPDRQRTPPNAVEMAELLLHSGAEVDAPAELYGGGCTTLALVVSSHHPAATGVQAALALTLVDHGAALDGPGSRGGSAVRTALAFGYLDTARALAAHGARVQSLAAAAGLGRRSDVARLLPEADSDERHAALALAAQHGHAAIVADLLDAGEDPDRFNPPGHHAHTLPLHQAAFAGHRDVVTLLVERGARLDVADRIYGGTPLDWARQAERPEIVEILRHA